MMMTVVARRVLLFRTSGTRTGNSRKPPTSATKRFYSYHELSFAQTGEPEDVLEYHHLATQQQKQPSSSVRGGVRVDMKFVPWNPADDNVVQGKYPSLNNKNYSDTNSTKIPFIPSLVSDQHKVAGSGGLGVVVESATDTTSPSLNVGDWVTPALPGLGTLRSTLHFTNTDLWLPVPHGDALVNKCSTRSNSGSNNGAAAASTLFQLGGTAYRMLQDFQNLSPGDWVVQNAGNSGVGFMVSQLAASIGVNTLSLVRRSTKTPHEFQVMKDNLDRNGRATLVIAEEDLLEDPRSKIREVKQMLDGAPVRLALNAVGGETSALLLKLLSAYKATHVTYGGMAQQPNCIGAGPLIFQSHSLTGYWHSRWMLEQHIHTNNGGTSHHHADMIRCLVEKVLNDDLVCPPCEVFPLSDFRSCIQSHQNQSLVTIRKKLVFDVGSIATAAVLADYT